MSRVPEGYKLVKGPTQGTCIGCVFYRADAQNLPGCDDTDCMALFNAGLDMIAVPSVEQPDVLGALRVSLPDRPVARATDPLTSKRKPKVNKYEQAVLNLLKGLYVDQGYTGKQMASLTEHPLNCITPRFAPLRRKGLIKDSGQRRDKQIVWCLV